jgi:CheY-like chemotaxis protein
MLGGDITVASEPGQGATFTVSVPAYITGTNDEMPPADDDAGIKSVDVIGDGVVLVVDDDSATRELLARFLERDGFRVAAAAGGREGLEMARSLAPRVILLDVTMPRMDGWAVLRAIRGDAALHDTPVIMVTVLDEQTRAYALGATDYLKKPVDWDELHRVMAQFHPRAIAADRDRTSQ